MHGQSQFNNFNLNPDSARYQAYSAAVEIMLIQMQTLFNPTAPPMGGEELLNKADDWTEYLIELIPVEFLHSAFKFAVKSNRSGFIGFADLLNGYELLVKQQKAEEVRQYQANDLSDSSCPICFGSGWGFLDAYGYLQPINKPTVYGVAKCVVDGCDYWQKRLAKIR